MPDFNRPYVDKVLDRLAHIKKDAKPQWGKLSRDKLYGHLNEVLHYSMGERPTLKDKSTPFLRRIVKPLILNGILAIPKGRKLPDIDHHYRADKKFANLPHPNDPPECSLEELRGTFAEFLNRYETKKLAPKPHPYFGKFTADEWCKFHMAHFRHHLKQFGQGKGM